MMRKIISNLFISLDGVIDGMEDWHFPYFNDEMGAAVDAVLGTADTLLLGRKTYDDHAGAWPKLEAAGGEDADFAKVLGDARKIVVSRQRPELTWRNSEQLQGDLVEGVTALKNQPGDGHIAMSGSISVVRQLLAAGLLDELHLGRAYGLRIASLRRLLVAYDQEITMLGREIAAALAGDVGYLAIQAIPGVGPVLAAVFVAEIGDVHRFAGAPPLCSWAGLTPRHRESDTTVRRGPITKQGPRLVRWAAVEATQRLPGGSKQAADFHRIADRRGTGIGRVAAARKLLTLVYYGLRDGQVRCLAPAPREAM
jgi:dihydrofolate reductase